MKSAIFFIVGIVTAVLIFGVVVWIEVSYLKSNLASYIVHSVEFNDVMYEIEGGEVSGGDKGVGLLKQREVIRIAHASVEARVNPLFGLEGLDIREFDIAVGELERSLEDFANLYDQYGRDFIMNDLYPIHYLESLGETEEARRALIEAPSSVRVEAYYKKLLQTITEYDRYNDRSSDLLLLHAEELGITDRTFNYLGGSTTPRAVAGALDSLAENARMSMEEVEKRQACYRGFVWDCAPISGPFIASAMKGPGRMAPGTEEISNNLSILNRYFTASSTGIVTLHTSACFEDESMIFYHTRIADNDRGDVFLIELGNELHFYDLLIHRNPYTELIHNAGIRYRYQSATNQYMCPDVAHDMAIVATLQNIRSKVTKDSFFRDLPLVTYGEIDLTSIQALEKMLIMSEPLDEAIVERYIKEVHSLLESEGEHTFTGILSKDKVLKLQSMLTEYHGRSARYDELLNNSIAINRIVRSILKGGNEMNLAALVMVRGYQPLMLGTFNRSIVQENVLFLPGPPLIPMEAELVSLSDESFQSFTTEEVLDLMNDSRNVTQSFIKQYAGVE